MHAGDIICILSGGRVPYVLREDGDHQYRLVGESYVHSLREGQALKEKKIGFTTYHIY